MVTIVNRSNLWGGANNMVWQASKRAEDSTSPSHMATVIDNNSLQIQSHTVTFVDNSTLLSELKNLFLSPIAWDLLGQTVGLKKAQFDGFRRFHVITTSAARHCPLQMLSSKRNRISKKNCKFIGFKV